MIAYQKRRRSRDNRGSAAVELVLVAPILMVLALFVVTAGRSGEAQRQVQHAADNGARAASQAAAVRREAAGQAAALADLRSNGRSCIDQSVQVMSMKIGRLNAVKVSVSCRIDHAGLRLLGLSERRVNAESVESIDVYRAE
jgi:Flp pilus assembly protein TadG